MLKDILNAFKTSEPSTLKTEDARIAMAALLVRIARSDEDALDAYKLVTKLESKINPSLEPCHAFSQAIKIAPKLSNDTILVVNSCGDAFKDRDILKERLGKTK